MKLNSPRVNPYSHWEQTKEKWHKEGYTKMLVVVDEHTARLDDVTISAEELVVMGLERFLRQKPFMSDSNKKEHARALIALQTGSGAKVLLEQDYDLPEAEVVERFMENLSKGDFKDLYQG